MYLCAMLLRRIIASGLMLLLLSTAIPLQFIHLVFHDHHDHEHGYHHHLEASCSDEDPCHLSLFHAAEHSEKACSHEAHFTELESMCCECSNYAFSIVKYLTNSVDKVAQPAAFSPTTVTYAFSFSVKYIKNCSDRGPPVLFTSL